jgi:cytochrome c-type biogenesis protein CcmH
MTIDLRSFVFAGLLALAAPLAAHAVQPDEVMSDPKLEQRARTLSEGLRCMVCQNQNIDDSDAPLAKDLRLLVRDRLKQGDSDDQVRNYLQARYGDFVLLKPPFKPETLILWITPAVVLAAAVGFAISKARAKRGPEPDGLDDAERAALDRLVATGNSGATDDGRVTKA